MTTWVFLAGTATLSLRLTAEEFDCWRAKNNITGRSRLYQRLNWCIVYDCGHAERKRLGRSGDVLIAVVITERD
jgi:hypothetical protein